MLEPLAERDVPELSPAQCFIDGQAACGEGEPFEVGFPVTGERLIELRAASAEQVDVAVAAARRSFDEGTWRDLAPEERAEVLRRTADILEARAGDLVRRILFDNAKTRAEARADVLAAINTCRGAAGHAEAEEEHAPQPEHGVLRRVVREPVGVVLGLTPYNAPLMFSGIKAAPALASGNSVVLKPSERAPLLASELCKAAHEAGLPPGVLNLVHGQVETAARAAEHRDVDMITLTGGTSAGSAVMRAAAPTIKNLLLELGGKSAHIVLADADLDRAIPAVAAGIFRNAGQRCFSGSRLVVEESVAWRVEEGVAEIAAGLEVGDPFDEGTQVGAMIDEQAVRDVDAFVGRAMDDGLRVAAGGHRARELEPGAFYRPTVLLGAGADSHAARTEIFGPVLTVIRVRDAEEAVRVANSSDYGLAGGVWSRDLNKAQRVARAVRAGYMWINTYAAIFGDVPFGGYGQSGVGRETGRWGYEAYTEAKTIMLDTTGGASAPIFE
ncbi:MAG: aldehyde dehydrogenase [bacterium]|nr:aldehyde dehydrogenase [bacterium]